MKSTVIRWIYLMPVCLLCMSPRAQAQSSVTEDKDNEAVKLAKFVVTGSNIPTAADATDVPVVVLGQNEIAETGLNSNLLQILRKAIPAFAGRSNTGNSNVANTGQNTAGGSQIALRNLDTLVLINGRRIATSGINGVGGKSFVDVNMIPAAAIERIEVLTDGASAIYGSDAVGGVINIILKNRVEGGELGGRYAVASGDGNYAERSGYLVGGARTDTASVTVTGSWSKTDPLLQKDRAFIANNPKTGTNFPGFVSGNYLNPALNSARDRNPTGTAATATGMADLIANGTYLAAGSASIPTFNLAPYQDLLLEAEQRAAVVSGQVEIFGKKLVVFGDYMHADTKTSYQDSTVLGNLRTATVPAGSPYNPTTAALAGVVVATNATPVHISNQAKGDLFNFGFRGDINDDWNWEVGYTYSKNKVRQQLINEIYLPNFTPAIAGGFDASGNAVAGGKFSKVVSLTTGATVVQPALDPFARAGIDPASLANVYGTELIRVSSKLESYDAKVVGTPLDVPAGKVGVAAGAATRKEGLTGTPDNNSYTLSFDPTRHNWAPGKFFDPFNQSRTIDSFFGEVRIPVTSPSWNVRGFHALDLSLAGRSERYSDAGKSNIPKVGLRWNPVDEQVTFRFTYSKAFTAPTLSSLFSPQFANVATSDLLFNAIGNGDARLRGLTYFSGNGNNPKLGPSTAISRSMGVSLSPKAIKNLTLTLNYVNVSQVGLPAGIGAGNIASSVNALGSASPYFSAIAIGGLPGAPGASQALLAAPGGLYNYLISPSYNNDLYLADHMVNTGGVHVQALDFEIEYRKRTESLGTFTLGLHGTYLKSFQVSDLPGQPFYEYSGYSTNGKTMSGSFPKYSVFTTVGWEYGNWDAQVGNTYNSSMTDIANNQVPAVWLLTNTPGHVASYTAWDVQLGYTVKKDMANRVWQFLDGLKVTVGINNVFDRMPPYALLSQSAGNNNNNADTAQYSPIGRLYFVAGSIKF